jgi:hypothetical protein
VARTGTRAGRESVPTAATVKDQVCNICESHPRAVGIVTVAAETFVLIVIVIAPDNFSNCCFVGSSGGGEVALVVMNARTGVYWSGCARVPVLGVEGMRRATGGPGRCGKFVCSTLYLCCRRSLLSVALAG